jgi:hypothetical protein
LADTKFKGRAKVSYFRIYDLRSTYATKLRAGGVVDEWGTLLRQADAKVFKKYSQMKLQMKREALAKLNRQANKGGPGFGTVSAQWNSESDGAPIDDLFWNQQEVWSGRGDLNARPPAPKAVLKKLQKQLVLNYLRFNEISLLG